ncbi:MAG: B12-binding domain-containing radical SAM protein [Nitrospirae bacterium]|nr:B12-binding domain-containing radical SAM protein [Nitrospirota bacterium]
MTKAAFIDFSCNVYDKHHVYTLASYLGSKGFGIEYINEDGFKKTLERIREIKPDLLLYSAFSIDTDVYFRFDEYVKKHLNISSILGGAGPTFDWGLIEKGTIDALCVGEGEYTIEEFIENGFSGGKNIIMKGQGAPSGFHRLIDLDSIPIPDRSIVYEKDIVLRSMPSKQFLAGRGCPYNCTYCFNNIFNRVFKGCGQIVRFKSIDYLVEEIHYTFKKYPFKNVVFHDDTFISNRKWFFEFCERFPREVGLNYSCMVRADLIDEDVARALKDSGCISANWSIECGNDYIRNSVLKRNMSREQILEAGRLLNKYNIPQKIANMSGLPGERFDDMIETLKLNMAIRPQLCMTNIFIPFPGVELTDYALKNNYMTREALNNLPNNFYIRSALNYSPAEETKIQKFTWLFQAFVDYQFLFNNKTFFMLMMSLPKFILRPFFEIYYLYKFSKQYNIKTPFRISWLVLIRHLKGTFGLHRPDRKL